MAADAKETVILSAPSEVEHKGWKFLICDAPTDENIRVYLRELKSRGVTHLARACEKTYNEQTLIDEGIVFKELFFEDGSYPPEKVAEEWVKFCFETFGKKNTKDHKMAVHCVAGLGRAPVLVAIAMLELRLGTTDTVDLIRKTRRGAINQRQLKFLMEYKPGKNGGCILM